jgi:hypothetical protein
VAGYKGHVAGGLVFFGMYIAVVVLAFSVDRAYLRYTELELVGGPLVLMGLCVMFALWPDVDTNSKGQDLFYSIFFVVDVALIAMREFQWAAYLGLFAILPILGKHRGWTHTYWAMLLVPSPLLILPAMMFPAAPLAGLPFYGAAVVGYFSHLVMDGMVFRLPKRKVRR